jgi:hypothetical protein
VAQIAVCAVFLVTAAGLLGELRELSDVRTGLDIDGVVDVRVEGVSSSPHTSVRAPPATCIRSRPGLVGK